MSGEGDDGIDAAAVMAAETNPSCSARPRPPAPVAPGDPAPSAGTRIGRVVAVRKVYDRYLSVEQRDVEVDVAGAKVREKERTGLSSFSSRLFLSSKTRSLFLPSVASLRLLPRAPNEQELVSYDVVSHPRAHCAFVVAFPFHPAAAAGAGGGAGGGSTPAADAAAAPSVSFPSSSSPPPPSRAVPTVTLLREYCHGINGWLYTLPTGGLDPRKHGSEGGGSGEGEGESAGGGIARAAAAELSEEARLEGGDWECLLPDTEEEGDEASGLGSGFPNPLSSGVPEAKWCANRFWPFLVVGSSAAAQPGERDAEEELGTMEVLRVTVSELKSIILRGRMLLPSVQASFMALERLRERGLL